MFKRWMMRLEDLAGLDMLHTRHRDDTTSAGTAPVSLKHNTSLTHLVRYFAGRRQSPRHQGMDSFPDDHQRGG